MTSHQYRPPNSPIKEHGREGEDIGYHLDPEEAAPSSSCFCFQWWNSGYHRNAHRPLLDGDGGGHHRLGWEAVKEKLMKVREVSEVVAGPKWKTFIRRIGGYFRKNKTGRDQFRYDSESYALNFDGGFDREDDALMYDTRSSQFTGPSLASKNEQNHGVL